jgi:4-hydroxy-2-oxoglutarate aldolase
MRPALSGIIAAIPTPFEAGEELALDALTKNIARWNETGLSGYTVLGTTGEFVSLTTDEKTAVLLTAREAIPDGRIFVAGTGTESTRGAAALTKWAGGIGADYAIVVTPHFNRRSFTPDSLVDHYRRVADESSIPVVVYHNPPCTALALDPETVARISRHENVAGIKDSSGDLVALSETKRLSREGFAVLTGSASILLAAYTVGVEGAILADASVAWEPLVELVRAFEAGDIERARRIQTRLVSFNRAALGRYGIPGVKALLDRIGFYGGPPRRPLQPVPPAVGEDLERGLREAIGT